MSLMQSGSGNPEETVTISGRKPDPRPLRIGEWIADPATNELTRGSETVRLEPRSMDVLVALARRAGQVVSREELFAAAWPGVVVGDEALSQSITKLRRALGDNPRSPGYIETLSKRGYRLVAPVSDETAATPPPPRARRKPRVLMLAVALLLVGAAVAATWLTREPAAPAASEADERAPDWVTVAVLPFEGEGETPYLARGISDSLATELGRLSRLRMIATAGLSPAEARKHARYVVSGSVARQADRLRVHVALVDTRSNEQLWSERFERPANDLFAVQDEMIRKLGETLPARMSASERQRLAHRHTRSLEAYDHFLRARMLFLARGALENEQARELYRRAIEIDPGFARAYAGLAMTHAIEHRLRNAPLPGPGLARALELAESARTIDPEIPEVHWALGFIHAQARRHPESLASLQRAIDLNPSFADAHALMAGVYTYQGEPARSIPLLRTAMRLEPAGGYLYFLVLGRAYLLLGDHEQALINLRAALARNAADLETRILHAAALAASGDRPGAEWEVQEIRALDRSLDAAKWLDGYPLASAPHRERLAALLAQAGL
jgi:DNA-binding winged helix-turn-helix (wHTH) protein/TolB-like protein/Flp pilus assembly protein TadD